MCVGTSTKIIYFSYSSVYMQTQDLLANYHNTKTISDHGISHIQKNRELRSELCKYFRTNQDRTFAVDLLNSLIERRKAPEAQISIENLMLGCYVIGLHQQIEDCLLIWKAKNVDFDAYCGVDIQLMAFAGILPTIDYLKTVNSNEAAEALEYFQGCLEEGDFDNLETYFSPDNLLWWI
jgi:hypothetical protein